MGIHNAMIISIQSATRANAHSSLDGVWTRRSLSVEGQAPFEDSRVTWAQLGPWFVDLRSPHRDGARPAAFSGRVEWTPPRIRFLRDLDLAPENPDDTALLEIGEDQLVERGEVMIGGRSISYVEVWTRRQANGGSRMVLEGRTTADGAVTGRLIRFDDVLVALVAGEPHGVQAVALEAARDGWRLLHQVGVLEPPPPKEVAPGCRWAGLEWTAAPV